MDRHGALPAHLHAGRRLDRAWHELVAGAAHHRAGQRDRAGADSAECAPGHQVRHSVSSAGAQQLRHGGRQCARHSSRGGGVRMVRHPDLHRWRGGAHLPGGGVARVRSGWWWRHDHGPWRAKRHHLRHLLADQHRHHPVRHERRARVRELECAADPADGRVAAGVGGVARGWPGAHVPPSKQLRHQRRLLEGVRAQPHRHDRLLGNAQPEHSGLHALRSRSARADAWSVDRPAHNHDRLQRDGGGDHQRGRNHPEGQ